MNNGPSREFSARLREAGVVGAGGAGFPAYVKASGRAEYAIINAAECEPLLKKDQKLFERYPEKVLDGLELMMASVGAARGVVAIKKKHEKLIKRLEDAVKSRKNISVVLLGDYYPAGDEHCLVYEVTGRLVPMGGIPLDAGCVVNNVETLYNTAFANERPVTEKYVTITGAVKKPCTLKMPVGSTYAEAIELAGGVTVKDAVGIDGGPMMGRVVADFGTLINKTSAGLIVLPRDHQLIVKKAQGETDMRRVGRSACDQCSYCTEFCPRYLLGHNVQPHKAMRSLLFSGAGEAVHNEAARFCCECSLCTLYSCPESLNPKGVCVLAKGAMKGTKPAAAGGAQGAHPVRDARKVPVSKLIKRLGLADHDRDAPMLDHDFKPKSVRIELRQHIGQACVPAVAAGQQVKKGDVVGNVPEGKLGCPVHASIDGKISRINDRYVEIEA